MLIRSKDVSLDRHAKFKEENVLGSPCKIQGRKYFIFSTTSVFSKRQNIWIWGEVFVKRNIKYPSTNYQYVLNNGHKIMLQKKMNVFSSLHHATSKWRCCLKSNRQSKIFSSWVYAAMCMYIGHFTWKMSFIAINMLKWTLQTPNWHIITVCLYTFTTTFDDLNPW